MPIEKEILAKYMNPIFIETGTGKGKTTQKALELGFKKIYTIEIDPGLYMEALNKFNEDIVRVMFGDSTNLLPEILKEVNEQCTIWLDAHIQSGVKKADSPCPLIEEVKIISNHPIKTHTILIDDRRLLSTVRWSNVTEDMIKKAIFNINPGKYKIVYQDGIVKGDIIVGLPIIEKEKKK